MEFGICLYSFYADFGRDGYLEGLFIASKSDVEGAIGKTAYFGEVLGKHSDISLELEEGDFEIKSEDKDLIVGLHDAFGCTSFLLSGYNPLDYIDEAYGE